MPEPAYAVPSNPFTRGVAIARARRNAQFQNVREVAPYHVHWKQITTYTATYRAGKKGKGKQTIIVRTVHNPPAELKQFQLSGEALKWFKRVKLTKSTRKVILIMATKTKKGSKKREKPVEDDTLEELDGLEEVDEVEEDEDTSTDDTDTDDTDEDEDTDDDTDDDESDDDEDEDDEEVEKPKPSKKKKGKKTTRAKANGKIGTQEVAEAAGCDARTLRMVLRKHAVEKDPETGRYEWSSLDHKVVKQILKWIKAGEAKEIKKESLDKLKAKKEKEKGSKKDKKNKKKKKEEDEDDE